MEKALDKLSRDIRQFLIKLGEKKKAYEDALEKDEVLYKTRAILREIKELEKSVAAAIQKHRKNIEGNASQLGPRAPKPQPRKPKQK